MTVPEDVKRQLVEDLEKLFKVIAVHLLEVARELRELSDKYGDPDPAERGYRDGIRISAKVLEDKAAELTKKVRL